MKFAENLNEYLDSHDISNYRIYKTQVCLTV